MPSKMRASDVSDFQTRLAVAILMVYASAKTIFSGYMLLITTVLGVTPGPPLAIVASVLDLSIAVFVATSLIRLFRRSLPLRSGKMAAVAITTYELGRTAGIFGQTKTFSA